MLTYEKVLDVFGEYLWPDHAERTGCNNAGTGAD